MNILYSFLLLLSCQGAPHFEFQYDLDKPTRVMMLEHPKLDEISGLSPAPVTGELCAISDESGDVYFLNSQTGALVRSLSFRLTGDFEGVEWTGTCLYAMKSDGDLFEIDQYEGDHSSYVLHKTPLKKEQDIEGLCFDPKRNALLMVSKGKPESPISRNVYAFDLKNKQFQETPVFTWDPEQVEATRKKNKTPVKDKDSKDKEKDKEKEKEDKEYFSPSGIAIHPITGHVYVISSAKRRLAVFDPADGAILHVQKLDKEIFPQPEGICFFPDGVMYISSEGKGGKGRILVFHPQG
jgi:uncharacterized protein YjiK